MENNLKGVIPNEMNYFEDLMKLELYYNELYGAIPDLYRLINLYNFDVDGNALEGAVPASLFNLPNIGTIIIIKKNILRLSHFQLLHVNVVSPSERILDF